MFRSRSMVPHTAPQKMIPSWVWGVVGGVMVIAGVILNEWVLAAVFSSDGELAVRNRWIVRAVQLCMVAAGAVLRLARRRIRVPVAGAVALCCALAVSPILAELTVRAVFGVRNLVSPPTRRAQGLLGWQTKPNHRVMGPHRGYGHVSYSTSDHGFRVFGDPTYDGFRVLVIGDSTTEASQVSDGETYYEVMAAACPGLEIFAYGAGGYGSLQEYLVLDAFIDDIDPALIVWQFDWNDLINNSLQWESMSRTNNNLMTRPYLLDGEVVLRFPVQTGRGPLLRLIQSSHLMRLVRITGRRLVTGEEPVVGAGDPVFDAAVETTRSIMIMVRERVGDRPIVAFCLCSSETDDHSQVYRQISSELGIHYLTEVMEPVAAAKAAGETVTGVEDGVEIDSHLNARGHRLLGDGLLRALTARQLVPCADGSE